MKKMLALLLILLLALPAVGLAELSAEDQAFFDTLTARLESFDVNTQCATVTLRADQTQAQLHYQYQEGIHCLSAQADGQRYALQLGEDRLWLQAMGMNYELPFSEFRAVLAMPGGGLLSGEADFDTLRHMGALLLLYTVQPGLTLRQGEGLHVHFERRLSAILEGFADYVDMLLENEQYLEALKPLLGAEAEELLAEFRHNWPQQAEQLRAYKGGEALTADIDQEGEVYSIKGSLEAGQNSSYLNASLTLAEEAISLSGNIQQYGADLERQYAEFVLHADEGAVSFNYNSLDGEDTQLRWTREAETGRLYVREAVRGLEIFYLDASYALREDGESIHGQLIQLSNLWTLDHERNADSLNTRLVNGDSGLVISAEAELAEDGLPRSARLSCGFPHTVYYQDYYTPNGFEMSYRDGALTLTDWEERLTICGHAFSGTRYGLSINSVSFETGEEEVESVKFVIADEAEGWSLMAHDDAGDSIKLVVKDKHEELPLLREANPKEIKLEELLKLLGITVRIGSTSL